MALGAGPAHAVYFACYEHIKKVLTPVSRSSSVPESVAHAVAGASATVLHDAVMTPAEGKYSLHLPVFFFVLI